MIISEAVRLLTNGEVVAFPTETVYGLGADALNPEAVNKIFKAKGRPSDNPLIVHIASIKDANLLATGITEPVSKLMKHFWPGPLTFILPKKSHVPDVVTGGLATVALRVPDHSTAIELIQKSGPLAAPSANISGRPSSTSKSHVSSDFNNEIPIVDGPPPTIGLESTVVDVTRIPFIILRPGAITKEQIESISGIQTEYYKVQPEDSDQDKSPVSPGTAYTHYKPAAKVEWFSIDKEYESSETLLITHSQPVKGYLHTRHFNGSYDQLASELYDLFRLADHLNLKSVIIEKIPENSNHALIPALLNRIDKAMV